MCPGWEASLVHGTVAPGWERVREEFVHNFRARGELGAALCVFHRGERVVDLWGGYADRATSRPWGEDTMAPLFSTTKGVAGMALHLHASRGRLALDERVAAYWPAFAAGGKGDVTVRDLIDHSVGLAGIDPPITLEMLQRDRREAAACGGDGGTVPRHLAEAEMEWPVPGERKGYMALLLGLYQSALVQRTDGEGRTLGKYLRDEVLRPLNIADELYVGLPREVPEERLARLDGMAGLEALWPTGAMPDGLMRKILLEPKSYAGRAFRNPQLSRAPGVLDYDRRDVLEVELPSSGGVGTARAVATMYRAFERALAGGGDNPLGLDPGVLRDGLARPARPGRADGWTDEILGIEICMGGGMLLAAPPGLDPPSLRHANGGHRLACAPGSGGAFGTPGAGGSFGFCDPGAGIAYAYVTNRCGQLVVDDPREFALRGKVYEAAGRDAGAPHYLAKGYMDAHPELRPLP